MRKVLSDKKTIITVLSIILVLTIMSSTTYAIFFRVNTFENTESYTAGVLDIEVVEGSTLSLANTLPITDSEGASLTPYTFTVKNVGNLTYTFDLKMLSTTSSNPINSSYIKVKLDDNEPVLLSSLTNGIIGSDITLSPGKSITMSIRIWLDINTPNTEIGKSFSAKIVTDGVGSEYVKPNTGADYITSLLSSNPDTMNNDDPDGNVRYMGKDPNNYVWFNNELWRIIGVFDVASTYGGPTEKRLKIIRDESIGTYSWDNKPSGTGSSTSSYGSNDWTDSALMEVLNNGAYWNRTSGTCPYGDTTTSCDFSSNGLTDEAKSLIGDAVWNLGGTASYQSSSNGLPSHFYGYERGETVYTGRPTYWVGKIGLMCPSDYGYATSGGATTNRASCLAKEMHSWDSLSDCKNNDYLYDFSLFQWTITPLSSSSGSVFYVGDFGYVDYDGVTSYFVSRPVLYLKSTVEITGGEGTSENPFTFEMPSVPATETISNIYTNAEKTTVVNNSVNYEYATSVGMMEDVGGNIRYYGADPNNYVRFNNELWRIIGVFNDIDDGNGNKETRIKIAKNESIGNYAWDSNDTNEWSTATLQTYLNGDYLNSLTTEAKGMVGNAKWNLGGSSTYQGLYANDYYTFERGTTVYSGRSTEWTGKIALMYPSDYMYAGDLSKCSKDGYNWDTDKTNCRDTSWLRNTSTNQWTLTPLSSLSNTVFYVNTAGYLNSNLNNVANSNASRPVLYLASTVEITGGEGTSENPFTLN